MPRLLASERIRESASPALVDAFRRSPTTRYRVWTEISPLRLPSLSTFGINHGAVPGNHTADQGAIATTVVVEVQEARQRKPDRISDFPNRRKDDGPPTDDWISWASNRSHEPRPGGDRVTLVDFDAGLFFGACQAVFVNVIDAKADLSMKAVFRAEVDVDAFTRLIDPGDFAIRVLKCFGL